MSVALGYCLVLGVALWILQVVPVNGRRDYYRVLGLDRGASDADIKTTFRRLAVQLHPDKNDSPDAAPAFQEVLAAFQVLSDPVRRGFHDFQLDMEEHHRRTFDGLEPQEAFSGELHAPSFRAPRPGAVPLTRLSRERFDAERVVTGYYVRVEEVAGLSADEVLRRQAGFRPLRSADPAEMGADEVDCPSPAAAPGWDQGARTLCV